MKEIVALLLGAAFLGGASRETTPGAANKPKGLIMVARKSLLALEVLLARQNGALAWVGDYPVDRRVTPALSGSAMTSESARRDFRMFQRNPVTNDGYRFIGGEAGYVYVGPPAVN